LLVFAVGSAVQPLDDGGGDLGGGGGAADFAGTDQVDSA
jgi:hypothetical protein